MHNSPEINTVSEPSDWKQKYRDSLREMEAEERRSRAVEQILRRLIGRLCAAGMGAAPQLDEELSALAAANRRNADVAELEALAVSLTAAVVAADAVPAPALRAAIGSLLDQLRFDDGEVSLVGVLLAELASVKCYADLIAVVTRAADLIRERGENLARERLQAAAILAEVTKRLEEVAGYLAESSDANRSRFDDAQSHNATVILEVRELTDEVSSATELGVLQTLVARRLERVAKQVADFRAREADRLSDYNARAEQMRARIANLERETHELHLKLDSEKSGARVDPLTGVANRKSFEETFAQHIAQRTHGNIPVVMLLWDIDSFKLINDSYGHRAGDRVLQTVAASLSAALPQDFVARIGGEEFVVLLRGHPLAAALQKADQLRATVAGLNFRFRGTPVRVTASCGITEVLLHDSPEAAFDRADAALYSAKHRGKNLCVAA
jgi:diguanylate cyclase